MLRVYYKDFFPIQEIARWLTHDGKYPLKDREFRFGEHCNLKVEGFLTSNDFRSYLVTNQPNGVNMGYYKKSNRELNPRPIFFDVDLDDFCIPKSDNRPSHIPPIDRSYLCNCKEKQCCDVCWEWIMKKPLNDCLDFLKNFMKFKRVFAIYSGGRGFWIYIDDDWEMDREARESLASRIPTFIDKKVTTQTTHLMKVPLTTHRTTGVVCSPIMNPETFLPSKDTRHYSKVDMDIMKAWIDFLGF